MPPTSSDLPGQTPFLKGRGAQINPPSRYEKIVRDEQPLDWALVAQEWEDQRLHTQYLETHPKTILNAVASEDIPLEWSMNPYQGCEHGCIYCYARNTHPYWGYSAGVDFERKILVKRNAALLLEQELKKKNWKASPVMFAGNTDVYQPAERHFRITRACLEVFWKYRHPVSVITKNSLILRDLDLLSQLAAERLVHVAISITTLQEELRQFLEPRTATVAQRLRTVEALTQAGVPVFVMMAPIIPGLNDHEILPLVKAVAERGALGVGHTMVRLNGDVALLFEDWIRKTLPDRADRVLNRIRDTHQGTLGDSRPGRRMRGTGNIADMVHQQFRLAKARYMPDRKMPAYNLDLHEHFKSPQLRLF
ncbi:MAG TPA: PA0069 family radical SAM protein [Saprospiraceae bacterium]|nr:PA0069 family radical SAM protein [Saprospiraceae bacterium]HND87158.1 PA0069 family radical SAM protein [Saprospiraceae bacterium]